jgi:hypothetical protein
VTLKIPCHSSPSSNKYCFKLSRQFEWLSSNSKQYGSASQ